jgi:hypothetical protein
MFDIKIKRNKIIMLYNPNKRGTMIMQTINIKNLDKAKVLKALYDNSRVQGMGFLQARPGPMTLEEAKALITNQTYFDYLHGKVMKIDLSGDELNPWGYDRDNGEGAAQRALASIA